MNNQIVISCSNDTTVKLWSLAGLLDDGRTEEGEEKKTHCETKKIGAVSTLNEDYDYVRGIAYSEASQTLYSAADNGIVRKWDLNASKHAGSLQVRDPSSHLLTCRRFPVLKRKTSTSLIQSYRLALHAALGAKLWRWPSPMKRYGSLISESELRAKKDPR